MMSRRSDHSREQLYDLALDAARTIVETDGYRALTARNVADAIGYSPGTLYNVFANLDEMVLHLNGRTLDTLRDRLGEAPLAGDATQDVNRLLDGYLAFIGAHPHQWRVLFEHSLPDGQGLPEWYTRKIAAVLDIVESALSPLFGEDETEARANAAGILWAALHGITSLAESGKLSAVSGRSVEAMTQTLVKTFIAGLKAR